jgi:hypothetical protein
LKTQIFIRPGTENLITNNTFLEDEGNWTDFEDDISTPDPAFFGLLNDRLTYYNPDGYHLATGSTLFTSTSTTTLQEDKEYDVTIYVDTVDIVSGGGTSIQYVQVSLGGATTSQFTGTGLFSDTVICGAGGTVSIDAIIDSDTHTDYGNLEIKWIRITEKKYDVELDLYNDIDIPLTYTIADIREPEKRKSSFAKSFVVPSTPRNDKLFGHIFSISGDSTWNPNKKADVYILQDGIEIFNGVLQLTEIKITDNYKIEYEVDCAGKLANIFYEWGSLKLKDLPLTQYTHLFDKATQKASWESYIYKDLVPYVNYDIGSTKTFTSTYYDGGYVGLQFSTSHGFQVNDWIRINKTNAAVNPNYNGWHKVLEVSSSTQVVIATSFGVSVTSEGGTAYTISPKGEGYVYPMIDYGNSDGTYYKVENTYPAVYLKTYIDAAFELAGFKYSSTFFDSKYFKHLVIPFNSDSFKIGTEQVQERLFKATKTTTETTQWNGHLMGWLQYQTVRVLYNDDSTNGNFDANFVYNPATGEWTVNRSGNFDIKANITVGCLAIPDNIAYMAQQYSLNSTDLLVEVRLMKNPIAAGSNVALDTQYYTFVGGNQFIPMIGLHFPDKAIGVERLNYDLTLGDKVYVEVIWHVNHYGDNVYFNDGTIEDYSCSGPCGAPGGASGEIYFKCKGGSFWNKVNNTTLPDGGVVELAATCPDVTIKDLFTSVLKLFNLYIETDKDDERKLVIETRNEFYSSSEIVDWTKKLDTSKVLELKPMGELQAREYIYSYKEDKDVLNADHQKVWGKIYGEKNVIIDNDFTTAKSENKVIFAPTVLQDRPATTDRIISCIRAEDAAGPKAIASAPRLLYYGGVKYTSATWSYKSIPDGNTSEHYYAYAGHLDNPLHPVEELNFTAPLGMYYDLVEYTDNNLFNKYHSQMIEEITDKNSKIVTGYFYLKASDIYLLDFRKQYFVDGNYLRLNKIVDYNGSRNEVSKCEFIKTLNKAPFKPVRGSVWGGKGEVMGSVSVSKADRVKSVNDNTSTTATVTATGYRNSIASTVYNANITGDDNRINSGASNIEIRNSSNITIGGGLTNVVVINSNGLTITESDVMYINNMQIKDGVVVQRIDLVDGGEQVKLSPFGTITNITFVDGGEDEILGIGSAVAQNFIDGGEV